MASILPKPVKLDPWQTITAIQFPNKVTHCALVLRVQSVKIKTYWDAPPIYGGDGIGPEVCWLNPAVYPDDTYGSEDFSDGADLTRNYRDNCLTEIQYGKPVLDSTASF